jgi:hypothetical protein
MLPNVKQSSDLTYNFWNDLSNRKTVKQSHNTRMEAQGERRYSSYLFTTSELDGVSGQRHAPSALYPRGKDTRTHWIGGCVGPRAGLDSEVRGKIICLCRGWNLDRPVVQPVDRHDTTELPRLPEQQKADMKYSRTCNISLQATFNENTTGPAL